MSLDDATLQQVMERVGEMEVAADRQVGAVAFQRAQRDAAAKRVDSLEAAQRMIKVTAESSIVAAGAVSMAPAALRSRAEAGGRYELDEGYEGATRHVVDRMFVMRSGLWTDLRFSDERVVQVAAFSAAYFELVERLPELIPFFAVGQRVIIAADGLAIEIADTGATEWTGAELEAVLRAFGS